MIEDLYNKVSNNLFLRKPLHNYHIINTQLKDVQARWQFRHVYLGIFNADEVASEHLSIGIKYLSDGLLL